MDDNQTPIQRADQVWREYRAKQCDRPTAIRRIRESFGSDGITDVGAGVLLDDPWMPSTSQGDR